MSTSRRQAFTLVELLVVIAILALLLSILMPSLGRGKDLARCATCQAQQHQIGTAYAGFLAANKSKTPLAAGWTSELMAYLSKKEVLICTSDKSPSHGALDMAAVRVHNGSGTFLYDMPMQADSLTRVISEEQYQAWKSKGFSSSNPPPETYEPGKNPSVFYYAFEDLRPDGGDRDFEDIILRVEEKDDGSVNVQQIYNGAGYTFQFMFGDQVVVDKLKQYTGQIPIKGYRCSYGMNTQSTAAARMANSRVILTLDYAKTLANCAGTNSSDNWNTWTLDGQLVFARHQNMMNVLFIDGSVAKKSRIEIDPYLATVRNAFWLP